MRAIVRLRESAPYRRRIFCEGLHLAGFRIVETIADPQPDDLLVTWNRYGSFHVEATHFESVGSRVLVVENGYLGKDWLDGGWYAMALGNHAGAGTWPDGGPERWDELGVEIAPWREGGSEIVILEQRGIGPPGIASPVRWAEQVQRRIGGRIRRHPGKGDRGDLLRDLRDASAVVTWHSGGALKALLAGIPVWYDFDRWIGGPAAGRLADFGPVPVRGDRLATFRRLAWAMWRLREIRNGDAFRWLAQ